MPWGANPTSRSAPEAQGASAARVVPAKQGRRATPVSGDGGPGGGAFASVAREARRYERTRACSSLPRRIAGTLGGRLDEGGAAERGQDLGLHLVHGGLGAALEAQGPVRVGVRGPHEAPALGKEDAHPVDVDGLVAPLELRRELGDHGELLVVGAGRLELR